MSVCTKIQAYKLHLIYRQDKIIVKSINVSKKLNNKMGDLESFPFLKKPVLSFAEKHNFEKKFDIKIESGSSKGDGYSGEIYFVCIKDSKKMLNVVVKTSIRDKNVREKFPIKDVYNNEIYFYSTVYPRLKKFEKKVNAKHEFKGVPQCYSYFTDNDGETLCFENLKIIGFELAEQVFDKNHLFILFDTYAHLHALSFAYQDQNKEEYKKIVSNIDDIFDKLKMDMFIEALIDDLKEVGEHLKQTGHHDLFNKFKHYPENLVQIFTKSFKSHSDYVTIIHGDSWKNNMMFKYEARGDEKIPIDMKIVDFQMTSCLSPAKDLIVAFYTSGSSDEFARVDEFLQFYHQKFSKYLKDLGSDPEKVFPFIGLIEDWKKLSKVGFIPGLLHCKIRATKRDEIKDLKDMVNDNSEFLSGSYNKKLFQEEALELIQHFYDQGLL